ncbi:hypothetical protein Pla123a_35930 [Posidoniimonas polymericola]|uniref:Uncharacterized protein n=1 Tax=Posidoniimonas polymericola TaxID=2528002 RepID=A0A5C5YEC6_9BACT|nr:hypothetical protein [Posidoniimonas polymericola]TWT73700.1 hypothetical protein Pla123a_35930 [Posidoniimonas polymericola]
MHTAAELEAYLDEALPAERMQAIEQSLRDDPTLAERLVELNARRDAGVHSLGAVWRRRRLTCPSREQLGSYALGVLSRGHADYVRFHLETVGCRLCVANLHDLNERQSAASQDNEVRRKKYFQSTVGRLKAED